MTYVNGMEFIAGRRALLISVNWTIICTSLREVLQGRKKSYKLVYTWLYIQVSSTSSIFCYISNAIFLSVRVSVSISPSLCLSCTALEPEGWKMNAHNLRTTAMLEMEKGKQSSILFLNHNIYMLSLDHRFVKKREKEIDRTLIKRAFFLIFLPSTFQYPDMVLVSCL